MNNALSPISRVECGLETGSTLQTTTSASEVLIAVGAIARMSGEPRPILIGDLQWLTARQLLIFTAYGEAPTDAHLVHFDEAIVSAKGGIIFLRGDHITAEIQCIEDADLDDPDDYRIAWQFWQEVAPLYRPLIQRCYDTIQSYKATQRHGSP